jgi:hypothetical protein
MNQSAIAPPRRRFALSIAVLASLMAGDSGAALGADAGARVAEVQINLCEPADRVIGALGLKGEAPRQSWYFESRDLALQSRGLVFRLRQTGATAELTLKVARQDCSTIPPALIPDGQGKCEFDLHGESMQGAVSLSRRLNAADTADLLAGRRGLSAALSATQVRFLQERVGLWPLPAGIERLGPVSIATFRRKGERLVVEAWTLPGGERYLEISQKSDQAHALQLRAALLERLEAARIAVCTDQSSQSAAKLRQLVR